MCVCIYMCIYIYIYIYIYMYRVNPNTTVTLPPRADPVCVESRVASLLTSLYTYAYFISI